MARVSKKNMRPEKRIFSARMELLPSLSPLMDNLAAAKTKAEAIAEVYDIDPEILFREIQGEISRFTSSYEDEAAEAEAEDEDEPESEEDEEEDEEEEDEEEEEG